MRPNFTTLIKQELVTRFENVVQNEIRDHNLAIERSDREISLLKERFREIEEQRYTLKNNVSEFFQKTVEEVRDQEKIRNESFQDQRKYLSKWKKDLDNVINSFEEKSKNCVSQTEFKDYKNGINGAFGGVNKQLLIHTKAEEKEMYDMNCAILERIEKSEQQFNNQFSILEKRIANFVEKLEENIINAVGINRMIKIDQKNMFVMEKKIENLYTLMERLNKRVDVCPKQD